MIPKSLQWLLWPSLCGLLLATCILLLTDRQQPGYADAVSSAAPAVANIYTSKLVQRQQTHPLWNDPLFRHFFRQSNKPEIQRSLGSAVVVDQRGYLLTNYHVIKDADEILVALNDGREALASVVGHDAETDLAVLKIDLNQLQPIEFGQPGQARVGDIVLAIGNPYGFGQTVTQGIISATDRYGLGISQLENFIQTDAAINPGNSGGALIDTKGRLLGINTAIYTRSGGSMGIGLAVPADLAIRTMQDLIEHGSPQRGWLGIEVTPLSSEQTGHGVLITRVQTGGPADRAGLQQGDIIVNINGAPIVDGYTGMKLIAWSRPGETVDVGLQRGDRQLKLKVAVGQRPARPAQN